MALAECACPYNMKHKLSPEMYCLHLQSCPNGRKVYTGKYRQCKFNPSHFIPLPEVSFHETIVCPDRDLYLKCEALVQVSQRRETTLHHDPSINPVDTEGTAPVALPETSQAASSELSDVANSQRASSSVPPSAEPMAEPKAPPTNGVTDTNQSTEKAAADLLGDIQFVDLDQSLDCLLPTEEVPKEGALQVQDQTAETDVVDDLISFD